jgi:cbb3-type cytochrome oxidase maturation protein
MTALAWLIPMALTLAGIGLVAFMWALRSGQFDDLEGAAYRILEDDREEPAERQPPAKSEPDKPQDADAEKTKG